MIGYACVGTNDWKRGLAFYDALLGAMGAKRVMDYPTFVVWKKPDGGAGAPLQPFPGRFPGMDEVNAALRRDELELAEYELRDESGVGTLVAELPFAPGEFALLVRRGRAAVVLTGRHPLAKGDRLWCLRPKSADSPLAGPLELLQVRPA